MKKSILTAIIILFSLPAFPQNLLKGIVESQGSAETLIGASLLEAGTTQGTITSLDGDFTLSLSEGEHNIEVSYLGFLTANIRLSAGKDGIELLSAENATVTKESDGQLRIGLIEDANFLAGATVTEKKSLESLQALQNERMSSSFARPFSEREMVDTLETGTAPPR